MLMVLLVTGSNVELIQQFKKDVMQVFEMKDLGEMSYFLGTEIKQKRVEIFICQRKYAKEILKKFNMEKPYKHEHSYVSKGEVVQG